jgi:superfamily II DNA or RNA helicase
VLPTGTGKTYTTVHWLLERMAARPELRVLWLADRQELVDQTVRTFAELARTMPTDFSRQLRAVHGNANPASSIADPALDVAVVTRQSTLASFEGMGGKQIAELLTRPTVVVVDEAHHAVAPTYDRLLSEISQAQDVMLVGLTATPWPSGYGAIKKLRERFKVSLGEVGIGELIAQDVLARPVFHAVETDVSIALDPAELQQAIGRDLPSSVLRKLNQRERNSVIFEAWWNDRLRWGKTLLFAVDIDHADALFDLFAEHGAPVDVLHSEIGEPTSEVLARFRAAQGPTVLVSVGMLTEGVDVPDARTAFLARPTSSRILMRQMIGRVLRGPTAGGDAIAHLVDVHDRWADDLEVLSPVEIPGIPWLPRPDRDFRLPTVVDEMTGEPIPEDLLLRIQRQLDERMKGRPITVALTSSKLAGFYQLDLVSVPAFEHSAETWRELIDATLTGAVLDVRYPIELFADLHIPRPTQYDVRLIVEYVESQRAEPPFREVRTSLSVRAVAVGLIAAGAMTQSDRSEWLKHQYEATLAMIAFPSYRHLREAVDREVLALTEARRPFDPEDFAPGRADHATKLGKQAHRDLTPLLQNAAARGRQLLAEEEEYKDTLNQAELPAVEWSRKPRKGSWAYWTPRIRGRSKGRTYINVNCVLRAPASQVPDELLEFLLWHELCHDLTPNQGHDAEFRRLEAIWPDAQRYDHALDDINPGA